MVRHGIRPSIEAQIHTCQDGTRPVIITVIIRAGYYPLLLGQVITGSKLLPIITGRRLLLSSSFFITIPEAGYYALLPGAGYYHLLS